MTSRISIPAKTVLDAKLNLLNLNFPGRCSRCDAPDARQRETFVLRYEAGKVPYHQFAKKFRVHKRVRVQLPLCESCYQANFIEAPESCEDDDTALGQFARLRSYGILAGSILGGSAFLFLMKVIPLPASAVWVQYLWLWLAGAALLLFAISFGLTERKNRQLRSQLTQARLHRANVFAKMQLEDPLPEDEAIVIEMENEAWAAECAAHHCWTCVKVENLENQVEAS